MHRFLAAMGVTLAAAGFSTPAFAAVIDFTAAISEGGYLGASHSYTYSSFDAGGDLTVTLTPAPAGTLTLVSPSDSPAHAGLELHNDGVGIGDDEITYNTESLIVGFSRPVSVLAFVFLDLFTDPHSAEIEQAIVAFDGGSWTFDATNPFQDDGGYKYDLALSELVTDTLTFTAGMFNDGAGYADYALAALDVTNAPGGPPPVPLPAGVWLLGTGILALVGVSRRRRLSAAP